MMGQIVSRFWFFLLGSIVLSGVQGDCQEAPESRRNLEILFINSWSHFYCKIPHDGRLHNRTISRSPLPATIHSEKQKECLENFNENNPVIKRVFRPVQECIRAQQKESNTRRKTDCFSDRSPSSLTPELRKLMMSLVNVSHKCCEYFPKESYTVAKREQFISRRKNRFSVCMKRRFDFLLNQFNQKYDVTKQLDSLKLVNNP
ncbi:Oidioi.mRNA.OKI2018_I69.PAR.g8998.t1.cds [Oikopleura dioica]|uniref:Oidioi.mRNA.OKI2018_I69.PAR.g8998.t1.cds n=1 Tax=Oikopleura dioica TaxID=34765 RepID=A0ABN7RM70_OIKDI|nr:Oidioi.mRNA.OKI2018_I69.PAR.g8998.t1.cds [Oikopleura dioica]